MEVNIKVEDCLKSFKRGKAPRKDGLPAEFYEKFWQWVGEDVVEVMKKIMEGGELGEEFAMGVVIFLGEGQKEILWNWRPITLLNVDYKLLAKIVPRRRGESLLQVVSKEQTCAVAGRSISQTL